MTIEELKQKDLIILECLSGSKAYGLDTPTSDTDIKGVFILPKSEFYGLSYISQVNNESNDVVYYELGRFLELLSVNNPNILELLNTIGTSVIYKHPFMEAIHSDMFLSKLCMETFGKFAIAQIKKAKGLNKKIVNPIDKEKRSVFSFCYVNFEHGSLAIDQFLRLQNWRHEDCGLVNIPHIKNVFGLYHNPLAGYKGILKSEESNNVQLSSIPKGEKQVCLFYFNLDGYSIYCKEFKEYWGWVEKRNESRYQATKSHGKNYDAKNMMHVFRILDMAIEIGKEKRVNVTRPNRNFLLEIKSGKYEYEELLVMAEEKKKQMEDAFLSSDLSDHPNLEAINTLAYQLRDRFYNEGCK